MTVDEIKDVIETLRRQVSITARMFDRIGPEWYKHIDPGKLDIDNCFMCVIGQAGAYLFNMTNDEAHCAWDVFWDRYIGSGKVHRAIRMGLVAGNSVEAATLERWWKSEIDSRRQLDALEAQLNI